MNIYIVIPAHNEQETLGLMLQSLANQTYLPNQVIVVDDNSTDDTQKVAEGFAKKYAWLSYIRHESHNQHIPGSKVVKAFYKGVKTLDENFDIICKFDADIILPSNYLEELVTLFKSDANIGIAGGLAYIKKGSVWAYEKVADKNHVRGPFKAYRKECFKTIGGLKASIGWDTVDTLLAQYHGWKVKTIKTLIVKHLKPTGGNYTAQSKYLQGEAFYKLRYSFSLAFIATLKSAINKKSCSYFINTLKGYLKAKSLKTQPLVSEKEGLFIRKLRWKGIRRKLGL